ncbi:MAG: hypothetical protein H7259_02515 [Cytophagales bacterium]|nr:hypothetical protein [Cytophaga sp.]
MKKNRIILLSNALIILFLNVCSCSDHTSPQVDEVSEKITHTKDTIMKESTDSAAVHEGIVINNQTAFTVKEVLYASGEDYDSPEGNHHYFIGKTPVLLIQHKTRVYLRINHWDIELKKDTALFQTTQTFKDIQSACLLHL